MITGAARGIGLATAKRFLSEGWNVALLNIDGDAVMRATEALSVQDHAFALTCDVAMPDQVAESVNGIRGRWQRIDALVNNAGHAVFKPALDTSLAEFQRTMERQSHRRLRDDAGKRAPDANGQRHRQRHVDFRPAGIRAAHRLRPAKPRSIT